VALLKRKNMRKILILLLLTFSLSYASTYLDKFENKIKNISSIRGKFLQINTIEGFDQPQTFIGELYATKPDRLKIVYKDPYRQIILVEGRKSTVYTPEEKQAVISDLSEDFIIVKIFKILMENRSLKEIFSLDEEKNTDEGILISLVPKNEKGIKKVDLIIKKDLKIYKIKIYGEDSTVELQFPDIEYLDKKLDLRLDLPEDVEIIRQ